MVDVAPYLVVPGTDTERLVSGRPGSFQIGLVLKRTYAILPSGHLELLSEGVAPIEESFPEYAPDVAPPDVSPPRWDNDLLAFKTGTDVIVQGQAYSYGKPGPVDTELRIGSLRRVVRVHGERRAELQGGRLQFSPAERFDCIPLRFDRAYGGCDRAALAREGDPGAEALQRAQPSMAAAMATRFHYPRNPTGRGYAMQVDRESVAQLEVPNLEFPFDPITPERIAVGDPQRWVSAPLPAAYDWYHPTWFPRLAYMGLVPPHDGTTGEVPEAVQGWAPREILNLRGNRLLFFDPRFGQAAAPGLSVPALAPGADLSLHHVFPNQAERRISLPRFPRATISIARGEREQAQTNLNAVVVQPDADRVVAVFVARRAAPRAYAPMELAAMTWTVD